MAKRGRCLRPRGEGRKILVVRIEPGSDLAPDPLKMSGDSRRENIQNVIEAAVLLCRVRRIGVHGCDATGDQIVCVDLFHQPPPRSMTFRPSSGPSANLVNGSAELFYDINGAISQRTLHMKCQALAWAYTMGLCEVLPRRENGCRRSTTQSGE